jgi:hypothetical protein
MITKDRVRAVEFRVGQLRWALMAWHLKVAQVNRCIAGCPESAAVRRASMELTRELARLRNPKLA